MTATVTADRADLRGRGEALRVPTGRTWVDIGVLLALALLGVIGFAPSFGGVGFLVAGLGGLVLGAATGILTSMFRFGGLLTLLASLVGYFLVGTAVAVPSQAVAGVLPTLQSLASLAVGTVFGWSDVVTLSTPIGAPAYIAVVPYAAAWIVALVCTTLATRWLSSRPRAPWRFAVALAGPVLLYLAGILIGTDEPFQAGIRGVAFAVLAIVWLGWRRPVGGVAESGASRLRNRKLAGTAIIVASAVLLGGGAGFVLAPPKDQRLVLRDEIEPPFDPLDYPSPLSGFRHYSKDAIDDELFTVDGLRPGDVIRLATLDSFTGKLWNVTGATSTSSGSGSFALVGRALPSPSFITPITRDDVTFTISAYSDVWVPGVGYPTDFALTGGPDEGDSDNLRYNSATGSMVLTSGLHDGDTYTMDAEVQQIPSTADLNTTAAATIEQPPVEKVPDVVVQKAQEFAGGATQAVQQLEAIRGVLTQTGFLSHGRASDSVPSRAGHGADRITELLERPQMIGDEEQYASAFALMARSLGYPARVVMGFAPEIPDGGGAVTVTGENVTAWVEVAFDGVGWVPFDPTPEETDIPQDQVPKPKTEPQPQVRQPPRAEKDDDDLLTPVELDKKDQDDDAAPFVIPGWVWAVGIPLLVLAAIVFIPMFVIGLVKRRRLRRRRTGGAPHDRVAGAWDELVDQYSELGYEVPGKVTRTGLATTLDDQIRIGEGRDRPALLTLARRGDDAVFSGRDVSGEESEAYWGQALQAIEQAEVALDRNRRLLSRYRVRSARDVFARLGVSRRR